MLNPTLGSSHQLKRATLIIGLMAAVRMAAIVTMLQLSPQGTPFSGDPLSLIVVSLCGLLWVLLVWRLLANGRAATLADLGWKREVTRRQLGSALIGLLLCLGLVGAVYATMGVSLLDVISEFTVSQRILFTLIGLQAGFCEETVFRGYLQPGLIARLGRGPGIFLAALFFSVYHLQPNPIALGLKLVFGLIFGALYDRSKSLWPSALAHTMFWIIVGAA